MHMDDIYERRGEFFLKPSSTVRGALVLCLLLGVGTAIFGFITLDPVRIWASLLLNLFFLFSIALGGVAFSAMQDVIGAVWCRPIKRIHEGFGAFLPVAGVFMLIFFACIAADILDARSVYSWIKDPSIVAHFEGKNVWLQRNFMLIRDSVAVVLILVLAMWQLRLTTRRDRAFVEGKRDEAKQLGLAARDKLRYWSAPILIVYAFMYSLLAFDLLMSLAPTWFSTLWAGWLFAIMMQTLMATTLLFMFFLKPTPIGQIYKQKQFHDVGKLMHGFTVFFAYLTYAHVLTYWYGNMPEETEYYIHRLHGPWLWIVLLAPLFNFVLPLFVLIFKPAKWTPFITIPLALIVLAAQWFIYILIVLPQVGAGHHWTTPVIDVFLLAGFVGLFLLCYFAFAKRHPLVAVGDVLLPEALHGEH